MERIRATIKQRCPTVNQQAAPHAAAPARKNFPARAGAFIVEARDDVTVSPLPTLMLLPLLLASACGGGPDPKTPPSRIWTMADLQASFRSDPICDNPAGLPCSYFVAAGMDGHDVLQLKPCFAEGEAAAYITTDFWSDWNPILLEPMYFLVTKWDQNLPAANRLKTADDLPAGPIFSVGPGSAFYSPYWQVFYVEAPPGTVAGQYTSARQLFDDKLIMHAGPNRFASIGPADLYLPSEADISGTIARYLDNHDLDLPKVVASSQRLTGWIDGAPVSYVDFGPDNFSANADRVVEDVPLFLFQRRESDGSVKLLGAPNVGGVAPLFSRLPGQVSQSNRPHFGALWRLHFVTVPPSAAIFLPKTQTDLGLDPATTDRLLLRVALNADACFASAAALPTCVWLDSQAAIEDNIGPRGIDRTTLEPACPFVAWHNAPVPIQ
jgi:hypothetical protein